MRVRNISNISSKSAVYAKLIINSAQSNGPVKALVVYENTRLGYEQQDYRFLVLVNGSKGLKELLTNYSEFHRNA